MTSSRARFKPIVKFANYLVSSFTWQAIEKKLNKLAPTFGLFFFMTVAISAILIPITWPGYVAFAVGFGAALAVASVAALITFCALKLYDYYNQPSITKAHDQTHDQAHDQDQDASISPKNIIDQQAQLHSAMGVKRDAPDLNLESEKKNEETSAILAVDMPLLEPEPEPESVPEPVEPGMVKLTDGTLAAEEKVEAINSKLSREHAALFLILKICNATPEDRAKLLKAQQRNLTKFIDQNDDEEFPIIKSDLTLDEETRRIILCILKENGSKIAVHNPIESKSAFKSVKNTC